MSNLEPPVMSEHEIRNKWTVDALYKSLGHGDTELAAGLFAGDLEWWFHGPPQCQYMMKVFTGESTHTEFKFEPRNITTIDNRVIVEGWEGPKAYWVHVWTLEDGLITQFREYFNTWLTVRDLRPLEWDEIQEENPFLWQSAPRDLATRSLPGLFLAI